MQTITAVETMDFRIPYPIKNLQPLLGQKNLAQFNRIKGGGGVSFDRVSEIQKFFMNSALCQAGSWIYKIVKFHQLCQKLLVVGVGGHSSSPLYFVKLCVMV